MKKLLFIIILLGAAAGYYYYKQKADSQNTVQEAPIRKHTVEKGTIDLKVSTTGKVVSNLDVEIKSKASGQIISLPYDISDEVTSGALLCELDPVDENRNVAQQEASLEAARARLRQAEEQLLIAQTDVDTQTSNALAALDDAQVRYAEVQSRLVRQQDLYNKALVSSEELDSLRSEASSSERSLIQAQIQVAELKNLPRTVELRKQDVILNKTQVAQSEIAMQNALQRLKETKIYAPMDGILTTRDVQIGQIIASGISNVGGGTAMMTLSDMSRLFINASVDESDIGKIRVGQRTVITADAFPGKRFSGKVVRVAAKGVTTSNVVTFEVKIEVDQSGIDVLRPEMTGDVEIQADRREDVIILPNEFIQFGRGNEYFVLLDDDSTTAGVRTKVTPGLTDGVNTEITEGLKEGDQVLAPSSLQSRWARGEGGGPGGGGSLSQGMRSAAFRMSRGR